MPSFPSGLPTKVVTLTVASAAGATPATGTVRLTPNVPAVVVDGTPVQWTGGGTYRFDTQGRLVDSDGTTVGVRLLDNSAPGTNPQGWLWQAIITINGQASVQYFTLAGAPTSVDLTDLMQVDPDVPHYVAVPGPAGPAGSQGPAGATGPAGPAGPQGTTGATGPAGPAGATGAQGPAGAAGATGAQGPKGDTGDTGPQGPAGPQPPLGTVSDIQPVGTQAAGSTARAADAGHVHPTTGLVTTSGDQVIDGEKTFNDRIPVGPGFDPAFDNQLARKAYVDAQVASARIRTATVRITDDNLSGLPSAPSWTIAQTSAGTKLQASIPAAAGDRIRVCGNFMRAGSHALDWALLDSGGAIAQYAGSGTSTPLAEGNPAMYPSLSFSYVTNDDMFTVASGHLNGGMATIALAHQGTASATVYAHATYPWKLRLENIGPEPS